MNRKMTLFALPLNCWGLGERGLAEGASGAGALANALLEKKPARSSRPDRATPVKPAPACQRNSRRVRPQKVLEGLLRSALIRTFPLSPVLGGEGRGEGLPLHNLNRNHNPNRDYD